MNRFSRAKPIKEHDWWITATVAVLSLLGLITLISTNFVDGTVSFGGIVAKQVAFILVGILLYVGISRIDYSYLKFWQIVFIFYLVTLGLLVLVLFQGVGDVEMGARRWIRIGGEAGFTFQPSELAKIAVIVITAWFFSFRERFNEILLALGSFILILPMVVLIYLEPHGSMALIMIGIWAVLCFTFMQEHLRNWLVLIMSGSWIGAGIAFGLGYRIEAVALAAVALVLTVFGAYSRGGWRRLFLIVAVISAAVSILTISGLKYNSFDRFLAQHQKDRIEAFVNPEDSDERITWQVRQSKIAIGSGQVMGKGFGYGTQGRYNFLPQHQTDFLFASFAEQFGLLGTVFVILLYFGLIYKILYNGVNSHGDRFASMIVVGIGVKVLIEVFINLGTNTGIIPATGIPLPLMSAGGTITMVTFAALGLVQSVYGQRSTELKTDKSYVDSEDLLL